MNRFWWPTALIFALWLVAAPKHIYATPLATNIVQDNKGTTGLLLKGESALKAGLPSIANLYFTEALENPQASASERDSALVGLLDAAIIRQDVGDADRYLQEWTGTKNARYALRAAMVMYMKQQWDRFRFFAGKCSPEILPPEEKAAGYTIQGLAKLNAQQPMVAEPLFEKAIQQSNSPAEKAWIEAMQVHAQRKKGPLDSKTLEDLRLQVEAYKKQPSGRLFTQEYALALAQVGKTGEAIALLENELKNPSSLTSSEENQFLLLIGMLGEGTPKGDQALKRLLETSQDLALQKQALYLLAAHTSPEALQKLLTSLIESTETHSLKGDFLLLRAGIALSQNQAAQAEVDAQKALLIDPGLKGPALEMLATIAWHKEQYRTAADYLTQWKDSIIDSQKKSQIASWIGDCYFAIEDFSQASAFYQESILHALDPVKSRSAYQTLVCFIKQNQIEAAESFLDKQTLSEEYAWEAQWALTQALRSQEQLIKARQRLKKLQTDPEQNPLLYYRFLWLNALLAFEMGSFLESADIALHLFESLKDLPPIALNPEDLEILRSEALLLQGESLLALNNTTEATEVLQNLRTNFPITQAAIRSLLIEARTQAKNGNSVGAQQKLLQLADTYPKTPYAPIALYEAAILASDRGIEQSTQESLNLLERLVQQYPGDKLNTPARLKQGVLLCRLGDFNAAELLYKTLLAQAEDNQTKQILLLAQADCLLAQNTNPQKLDEAAALLERLLDQPSLPIVSKHEVGYKLGFALEAQKKITEAQKTYWSIVEPILANPAYETGAEGYWVARVFFALAATLEAQNETNQAKRLYEAIVCYHLPGSLLAETKLKAL